MKAVIALVFLFFLSTVSAASIEAPDIIPSNINWSFSVLLDPTDQFDSADIILDAQKIATIYSNSQIVVDPFKGNFVISSFTIDTNPSSTAGLEANFSYAGLKEGSHEIIIETRKDGSVSSSEQHTIKVINAFSDDEAQQLKNQLSGIQEDIDKAVSDLAASSKFWDEKIDSREQEFENLKSRINNLKSELSSLESEVSSLGETSIDKEALNAELYQVREQLDEVSAALYRGKEPMFDARYSPTALATYSSAPAMFGAGFVLVLAFALFYLERRNEKGLWK